MVEEQARSMKVIIDTKQVQAMLTLLVGSGDMTPLAQSELSKLFDGRQNNAGPELPMADEPEAAFRLYVHLSDHVNQPAGAGLDCDECRSELAAYEALLERL